MLGAGRGAPIGAPIIAALHSVDLRRRWPQQGEVPDPQLITVTSKPTPSPEALPHTLCGGVLVVTTCQATLPLPLPSGVIGKSTLEP
jgi:hypothetical protein